MWKTAWDITSASWGAERLKRREFYVRDQPKIADAASEVLQDVFGKDKNPCRMVYGVASLLLGTPVELELIFEVSA
jgi:enamine deaminase RidA (YjgF/YER057c/UK114 family)